MFNHFFTATFNFISFIHIGLFPPCKEGTDTGPDEGSPHHVHKEEPRCVGTEDKGDPQKNLHHRCRHVEPGAPQGLFLLRPQDNHEYAADKDINSKEKGQHEGHHRKGQGHHHPQTKGRIKDGNEKMPRGAVPAVCFHIAENLAYAAQDKNEPHIVPHRQKRGRRLHDAENPGTDKQNTADKKQSFWKHIHRLFQEKL